MQNKNHIHELIGISFENIERSKIVGDYSRKNKDSIKSFNSDFKKLPNAICFYGGKPVNEGELIIYNENLIMLPYETIWIEFSGEEGFILGVLCVQSENKIRCSVFVRYGLARYWVFAGVTYHDVGYEIISKTGGDNEKDNNTLLGQSAMALKFVNLINCCNIKRTEHKPDAKLQNSRQKRGKKPLFSYWTLELTSESRAEGIALGGTHESPRFHLRRGHPRQYAPSKWTWVQPCAVGNKKIGMVHKDYALAD